MAAPRKIKTKIDKIISFSDKVKLFHLIPEKRIPRFKPGQFLHLAIEAYDPSFNWPESRVFSIVNSPTRADYIEVLVSKIGKFTSKMFNDLNEGDEVWIKLPYGTFNFDESQDRNTVLIAGGTGISPFVSFIQYAMDNKLNTTIHLNYGVNNNDLLIAEDLIKEAEQELSSFKYRIYIEEGVNNNSKINQLTGLLDVDDIVLKSLKLENPVFYLSGPPAMISAFDEELKKHSVEPNNIKYDNWE